MTDKAPDLREFHELSEAQELRRQLEQTQHSLIKLRTEKTALVEAVQQGAKDALMALGSIPPVKAPALRPKGKGKPEVALWHLTDWQGAKETATYNSEVMEERIMRYCDKAQRLTAIQRADHPVDECVILFGGDMLEGLFQFPSQPFEIDGSLFSQFVRVARLEAEVVRRALATYERVTVVSEWGNHGRIGSKRAAVPRSDNMDRMAYELARAILSNPETDELHDRLTWEDSEEDIHHFEIGNYAALLIHGDEIGRHGGVSLNTIVNHVKGWKSGAYPKQFLDVYGGHLHSHRDIELPDGGMYFQTASPETDNRYARDSMAATSRPSQRLHFIEPEKGRVTAQYRVDLA